MVECRRLGRGFPKTALILHDRAHYVGLRSSPPHGVQEPCTGPEPAGPLPRILWAALPTNRPGMVLNLLGESLARHGACDSSAGSVDRDVTAPYLACRRALCGARPLGALSGREHCRSPLPDPWWSRSRSTQRLFRKRCADLQLLAGECDRGLPARGAGAGGGVCCQEGLGCPACVSSLTPPLLPPHHATKTLSPSHFLTVGARREQACSGHSGPGRLCRALGFVHRPGRPRRAASGTGSGCFHGFFPCCMAPASPGTTMLRVEHAQRGGPLVCPTHSRSRSCWSSGVWPRWLGLCTGTCSTRRAGRSCWQTLKG